MALEESEAQSNGNVSTCAQLAENVPLVLSCDREPDPLENRRTIRNRPSTFGEAMLSGSRMSLDPDKCKLEPIDEVNTDTHES